METYGVKVHPALFHIVRASMAFHPVQLVLAIQCLKGSNAVLGRAVLASQLEEVEERLRRLLKLGGYEARVYMALVRLGEAAPAEIAQVAGVPRQRVYDVLKSLAARGLVTETPTGTYMLVDPAKALEREAERIVLEAARIAEEVKRLGKALSEAAKIAGREELRIIYGVEQSIAQAITVARECGSPPLFTVYKVAERIGQYWPVLRKLIDSLKPGTTIVLSSRVDVGEEYVREAERRGLRIVRADHPFMDVMVACDAVLMGLPSSRYEAVTVYVRNAEFAKALAHRILEYVENSER